MYRQGDLLIIKLSDDQLRKSYINQKPIKDGLILKGETGNSHKLIGGKVYIYGNDISLLLETRGKVVHEEHDTIDLEPGFYRVIRQREYRSEGETVFISD